jgi:hypothetical protein
MKKEESIMKPPAGSRLLDRREFIAQPWPGSCYRRDRGRIPGTARAEAPPFKLPNCPTLKPAWNPTFPAAP